MQNSFYSFKELREQLDSEAVKSILKSIGVEPINEQPDMITYPTVCHNVVGGSPKLIYYKESHFFHCFTGTGDGCGGSFDIFTLLQRIYATRGEKITLKSAVELCGFNTKDWNSTESKVVKDFVTAADFARLKKMNEAYHVYDNEPSEIVSRDPKLLNGFVWDEDGLKPWNDAGIDYEVMKHFNIKYDMMKEVIVIPNYDWDGNLIGIRGRFLRAIDQEKGKYRPLYVNGELCSHPSGKTFYGLYENKDNIKRKRAAVIFEGEKSVLLYGTYYGNSENIALATLGQNITKDHIRYLQKMGVKTVVLAYDADYQTEEGRQQKANEYIAKAHKLSPYFNVYVIIDDFGYLGYKDSPIDDGKDTFEFLKKYARLVR